MAPSGPLVVKVRLVRPEKTDVELRRVPLPQGASTPLPAFFQTLENVFQRQLSGQRLDTRFTYVDDDGDVVAVETDIEMHQALQASSTTFTVRPLTEQDVEADWMFIGCDGTVERKEASEVAVPWTSELKFWLNGEQQILRNPSPSLLLVDWLREIKGLTGTKVGCGEGGCGICTVAISFEGPSGKVETVAVNSCLRRVCALDGVHVVTTEGIGSQKAGFHPVQKAIADGNGSQCGYCTPGWVMNMYALLQKKGGDLKPEEIEQNFDGNLCRCTGYRPILSAFGEFANGGKCAGTTECVRHPGELLGQSPQPLHFTEAATGQEWYRPLTLEQLASARAAAAAEKKDVRLLCANTSAGVLKYYKPPDAQSTVFVDISRVTELSGTSFDSQGLTVGANVPIASLIADLESQASKSQAFVKLAEHMKRIASVQIRSVASWAGNLMLSRECPSFASDMVLVLSTAAASVTVLDAQAKKTTVSVPELLALPGDITVISMRISYPPSGSVLNTYKTAQRHVFAHAIVNLGAYFAFENKSQNISEVRIIVGGATNKLLVASKTAAAVTKRRPDQETLALACSMLAKEIGEDPSVDERHDAAYKLQLAQGFLYKAFLAAQVSLPADLQSSQQLFFPADARPVSSGTESYSVDPAESPVSQFIPKLTSRVQASGEAAYTSDNGKGCLFGQLVFSTQGKAKLVTLDPHDALAMPGVVDFVAASDVPGVNCVDPVDGKGNLVEKAFFEVGDSIPCVGNVLGMVVADTWAHARQAAKKVVQKYTSQERVVIAMDEAERLGRVPSRQDLEESSKILQDQGFRRQRRLPDKYQCPLTSSWTQEDTTPAANATQSLTGMFRTGWQYHFFLETQAAFVTPVDGDNFEVVAGTQNPAATQANISMILNVPSHKVNVKVHRIGGGYGGKITRNMMVAQAGAVAAYKLKAPIRIQNERSDDMQMSPGRELCDYGYTVNFDPSGRVDTMDAAMRFGTGWFYGENVGDAMMGVQWADDCYSYRKFKLGLKPILQDAPHTTSCRAPGAMNASVWAQMVMERIAKTIGKPTEEVQEMNFYKMGDKTPFGDEIGKDGYNFTVPLMWKKLQDDTKYADRKTAIAEYNAKNKWTKKGIALSPVKYIADLYSGAYNFAVLLNVYADGSVLISHGGVELGQGINTKATLVAASALGIPIEKVKVGPTDTSKTPNSFCTGGSGTSESVCAVVLKACDELNDRLRPYRQDKGLAWDDAVSKAATDQVSLMVSAWHFWKAKEGTNAHPYATYGVAASEVLVDIVTGEVRVEKVDILMDLGKQMDAAIDLGQLQGGFVMAMGWVLTEEMRWTSGGTQLNLGTWEYKVPTAYDIPVEFNLSLLDNVPNQSPTAVKGSKLQAEPVMALIASVVLAIKEALYSARSENGLGDDWFALDLPLTPECVWKYTGTSAARYVIPE